MTEYILLNLFTLQRSYVENNLIYIFFMFQVKSSLYTLSDKRTRQNMLWWCFCLIYLKRWKKKNVIGASYLKTWNKFSKRTGLTLGLKSYVWSQEFNPILSIQISIDKSVAEAAEANKQSSFEPRVKLSSARCQRSTALTSLDCFHCTNIIQTWTITIPF